MALALEFNRLAPSLAMFSSFFLLGAFISALGPAVPSLSRDVSVQEVSFGMVFSLRGLGHLLGSWSSSFRCVFDSRFRRLRYGSGPGSGARKKGRGSGTVGHPPEVGLLPISLPPSAWCRTVMRSAVSVVDLLISSHSDVGLMH